MPLVSVERLFHRYPGATRYALADVGFSMEAGEYLAILGANGSGKSTLVRCLDGLASPESGSIRIDGLDPSQQSQIPALRARVGLVFQSPSDQIVASVAEEDCAFGPENLGLPRAEITARVEAALGAVGLLAERSRPPHMLSVGQQQRLAVAGALAMRPRLLILDEATAMIDPRGRDELVELLDGLHRDGTSIIHVTHSMEEAARAGRVLVLAQGRVVFDGTPAALFERQDLEAWSLERPPALEAARLLSRAHPRFRLSGLAPEAFATAFAEALAGLGRGGATPRPTARPEQTPSVPSVPSPDHGATDSSSAGAGEPDASSAFALRDVVHAFLPGTELERRALDGLSLRVEKGELVALIGPTGSGKSSALQHGNALLRADAGSVRVLGLDPAAKGCELRALRSRATLAVQRPETALFETYVGDDVAFGPRNQGLRGKVLVERVRMAMDRAGLSYAEFRDRPVRALSGGERRRAALAGVLALDGELLLLDEPSAGLDPMTRRSAFELEEALAREGRAVCVSTHSMEEAARADRVYALSGGRVVASGSPAELFLGDDLPEGFGRPWAAEASRLLVAGGLIPGPGALDPERLAAVCAEALGRAASAGSAAPTGSPGSAASASPADSSASVAIAASADPATSASPAVPADKGTGA